MGVSGKKPKINLRVTQASLNQTAFDFPRNVTNILRVIDEAVAQGSDMLCLEELALTGYDAGDDFQKTDNRVIAELLQDIARYAYDKNPKLIISIGHPYYYADKSVGLDQLDEERHKNAIYNRLNQPFNVQSFIGHGRILGMTAKNYLFGYERGYEKRYFAEWSNADADKASGRFGTIDIPFPGQEQPVPLGRPVIQLETPQGLINLTHVICEEKWIASKYNQPHGTDVDYVRDGVVPALQRNFGRDGLVIVLPNGSPPSPEKVDKHQHLSKIASQYADVVIDTDGLGTSGSTFAQHGYRLIVQDGEVISYGSRLNFGRVATTTQTISVSSADPETTAKAHAVIPHTLNVETYPAPSPVTVPAWDDPQNPGRRPEETLRMLSLWLFDYMRKTKSQGIAEALSGGADSAFNSAMVPMMVRLAVADLGVEGFCQEMKHLKYKDQILEAYRNGGTEVAIDTCLNNMLTMVYMGTNNSSEDTRNAARFLVEGGEHEGKAMRGIGGKFMERNVQDLLDFYAVVYAVENTSAIELTRKMTLQSELAEYLNIRPDSVTPVELKEKADAIREAYPEIAGDIISAADPKHAVAYENIQARARQVLIMLIANAEGKMAIANPNLDEGRNAYATFGGDLHSGTVNLNGFLPKATQLKIMAYLYEHGLEGVPPVEGFAKILKNKPSAELQPKSAEGKVVQNDEDALQRDFNQMDRISTLMLAERVGQNQERRLNPTEVFDACKQDARFEGVDVVRLFNMVRFSYSRWHLSQHKIHAAPITPTNGANVDHQTSLRTPNLSGQDRAELAQLGIRTLFNMAREEFGNSREEWSPATEKLWTKWAMHDDDFAYDFDTELRLSNRPDMNYDVGDLYQRTKNAGLASVFQPPTPEFRKYAVPSAHSVAALTS